MRSIRLPEEIEKKLDEIAEYENVSKSSVIKEALNLYLDKYYNSQTPYQLGDDLFGKYGSGKSNLSKDYKSIIKGKLREKHSN